MIFKDVIVGTTASDLVNINKNELIARLGKGIDLDSPIVKQYIDEFNKGVTYRYAYVKIPFKHENEISYFENEMIQSSALSKVLKDSKEVLLLSVTVGIAIDKLIQKISIQKPMDAFIIDAIASAAVESYVDYVNNMICDGLKTTKRFSPGYADFPLEFQTYLLNRLSTKENIGIVLSDGYLMIPMKSITAVIGIE